MKVIKLILFFFSLSFMFSSEIRPLAMKPFDTLNDNYVYQRGNYVILYPQALQEISHSKGLIYLQ